MAEEVAVGTTEVQVEKKRRRSPLSKRWVLREALPNVPPRPPKAAEPPAKPLKPSQCAGHMRKRLAEEFPRIVNGFVKQVKRGSVPHVRLATELNRRSEYPARLAGAVCRRWPAAGSLATFECQSGPL